MVLSVSAQPAQHSSAVRPATHSKDAGGSVFIPDYLINLLKKWKKQINGINPAAGASLMVGRGETHNENIRTGA
jgi:hypothetical protein